MNQLSKRMKLLRSERGIKQKELAMSLNCSIAAVSGYENGRNEPGMDTLIKIADFYRVSTDYLLGLTDLPDPVDQRPCLVNSSYPVSRFLRLLKQLSPKDRSFLAYGLRLLEEAVNRHET